MLFNALVSPEDKRDFPAKGVFATSPSWDIDFRPRLKSVRDQGQIGSCVAFATASAREVQESFDTKLSDYIAPWLTYINRMNQDSDGMWPRDAYKIMQKIGCLPESMCPYMSKFEWDANKKKMADLLKIEAYFNIKDRQDAIDAMNAKTAVTFSIPVYGSTGRIWRKENGPYSGRHHVMIAAASKTGILIRNSWGEKWDEDGYIEMSWEDFENPEYTGDKWVGIDKKTKNLTIKARLMILKYKIKSFFKTKLHVWIPITAVLFFMILTIILNKFYG